jgi:hypothetical protein
MDTDGQNPLARVERHKTSYPLFIAAAALVVVLVIGFAVSLKAQNWAGAGLFLVAAAVFVVLVLIYFANNRRTAALDDRKFLDWNAAIPELQRENINIEVREIARLLKAEDAQIPDLLSAYVVASDLALRQIQQEENLPLMRNVSIGKTPFDGILVDQDWITCIEVSFLVAPEMRQDRVRSVLKKAAKAKANLAEMKSRLRLRLMLVIVTQLSEEEQEDLRGTLSTNRFSDTPVDIDIRILDFETLQGLYLSE